MTLKRIMSWPGMDIATVNHIAWVDPPEKACTGNTALKNLRTKFIRNEKDLWLIKDKGNWVKTKARVSLRIIEVKERTLEPENREV